MKRAAVPPKNGSDSTKGAQAFGPGNPHPLSALRTQLVWEGKYDEFGNRREVDAAGLAMPLQRIETVDEPRSRTESQGELFDAKKAHLDDFRNMLVWGDNKLVVASLLKEFRGKVDLIYIDPPFDVGADFTMPVPIGGTSETVLKDQSALEMVAYRDTWGKEADSYVHMLFERIVLMRELLTEQGHIVVHLAPTVTYYVRCVMDAVFGSNNFRSEIVVHRPISKNLQRQFETVVTLPQGHDVLLWYSSRPDTRVSNLLIPYEATDTEGYWHRFWSGADRPTMRYELLGETPTHGQWKWERARALRAAANYQRFLTEGAGRSLVQFWRDTGEALEFIRRSESGTPENWYSPSTDKVADTVWDDVKAYENQKEFLTQKHRELLTRLIEWLTGDGALVADFFCGSGTTGVVAEQLARPIHEGSVWTA
jgi:adenine-specific DNA-methyltransferase